MKDALRIGLCAAKANAVPMVALWTVSVALVAGYYLFPDVQSALDCLGRFQRDYGIWAGFSSQFVFCGYKTDIALRKAFRLLTGMSLADWRKANR